MKAHTFLPNCRLNLVIDFHALYLLYWHFTNTTAYHLGRYKPSSPSSIELHDNRYNGSTIVNYDARVSSQYDTSIVIYDYTVFLRLIPARHQRRKSQNRLERMISAFTKRHQSNCLQNKCLVLK